ncbi:carboxylesterase/lipase family protein [Croceicoccus sp. YJ47]|uniref:carboxylesterase/lipase family protein n=1 Tax=Croceicoccus sp. YJ47 TaxID=2798724 RepID=UPI00353035C3
MRPTRLPMLLAGLAAMSPMQAVSAQSVPRSVEQVRIDSGAIRGERDDEVISWKGIPFAQPPVGALRWRAPQPVRPWDGVRETTAYSPDCMQLPFPSDAAPLGTEPAEDCLYANVWRRGRAGGDLPVMVWIYGGGFVNGGASPPTYAGANLARDGIVVVSFNYRVGRFGTFAFPQLTQENADDGRLANYGAMDQIAALEWVRRNAAAFGGDPANVTIVGESAGGMSVHNLVTSPLSQGLFARAVVMSGGNGKGEGTTLAEAERIGENFARRYAIDPDAPGALAQLRALSAQEVTDGLNLMQQPVDPVTYTRPFADGTVLVDLEQAYARDRFAKVPTMIGATSADIGGKTGYMVAGARDVAGMLAQKDVPVWSYRFSYVADSIAQPGAQHASEIPFFFDNTAIKYGDATTAQDIATGHMVSDYLVNFVKTGNPNGPDLPFWPRYGVAGDAIMDFAASGEAAAQRDPWGADIDAMRRRVDAARASGLYNSLTTPIGTMLDDPAARPILARYFPDFVNGPQIGMARDATFDTVRAYMPQVMTDEKLTAMDAELAALGKQP